jgi:mTERF
VQILTLSTANLKNKLSYLITVVGLSRQRIRNYPGLLLVSVDKRMKPRFVAWCRCAFQIGWNEEIQITDAHVPSNLFLMSDKKFERYLEGLRGKERISSGWVKTTLVAGTTWNNEGMIVDRRLSRTCRGRPAKRYRRKRSGAHSSADAEQRAAPLPWVGRRGMPRGDAWHRCRRSRQFERPRGDGASKVDVTGGAGAPAAVQAGGTVLAGVGLESATA